MYSVTQVCRYDSETEVYPWSTLFPTLDEAKAEVERLCAELCSGEDASYEPHEPRWDGLEATIGDEGFDWQVFTITHLRLFR